MKNTHDIDRGAPVIKGSPKTMKDLYELMRDMPLNGEHQGPRSYIKQTYHGNKDKKFIRYSLLTAFLGHIIKHQSRLRGETVERTSNVIKNDTNTNHIRTIETYVKILNQQNRQQQEKFNSIPTGENAALGELVGAVAKCLNDILTAKPWESNNI